MTQDNSLKSRRSNAFKQTDLYYYYRGLNRGDSVDYSVYTKVLQRFNEEACEEILEGKDFRLPFYLGKIGVRKRPVPVKKWRMKVDFNATKREGITIYHLNEHSNYFYYRFYWFKGKTLNRSAYEFKPVRKELKRKLAARIKAGKDYVAK